MATDCDLRFGQKRHEVSLDICPLQRKILKWEVGWRGGGEKKKNRY
jgi:hypothetical protein